MLLISSAEERRASLFTSSSLSLSFSLFVSLFTSISPISLYLCIFFHLSSISPFSSLSLFPSPPFLFTSLSSFSLLPSLQKGEREERSQREREALDFSLFLSTFYSLFLRSSLLLSLFSLFSRSLLLYSFISAPPIICPVISSLSLLALIKLQLFVYVSKFFCMYLLKLPHKHYLFIATFTAHCSYINHLCGTLCMLTASDFSYKPAEGKFNSMHLKPHRPHI